MTAYMGRLKVKLAVKAGEVGDQAEHHLAQGRVDVKVELALDVPPSKLAKVCFVPPIRIKRNTHTHVHTETYVRTLLLSPSLCVWSQRYETKLGLAMS